MIINCKICGKEINTTGRHQDVCTEPKKLGRQRSECQQKRDSMKMKEYRKQGFFKYLSYKKRHKSLDSTERPCLECGNIFESKSRFNRFCFECKAKIEGANIKSYKVKFQGSTQRF